LHFPKLPEELTRAGLAGPRLTALVGWLKGVCHMSFSSIRKYFRDVIGVPVSRGLLTKLIAKVSQSLKDPYDELPEQLAPEALLGVDETGHKENGSRLWTWCLRAATYTLFKIDPSRGSEVLLDVLGVEFNGLLGCDYFSAQRKYMRLDENVALQFCLAHLIRDVKFLADHSDRAQPQTWRPAAGASSQAVSHDSSPLGENPSPLMRLSVQRVVATWLEVQHTAMACASADAAHAVKHQWAKRQESAERRYQLALRSLDLARRISGDPRSAVQQSTSGTGGTTAMSTPEMNEARKAQRNGVNGAARTAGCTADVNAPSCSAGANGSRRIVPRANGKKINRVYKAAPSIMVDA